MYCPADPTKAALRHYDPGTPRTFGLVVSYILKTPMRGSNLKGCSPGHLDAVNLERLGDQSSVRPHHTYQKRLGASERTCKARSDAGVWLERPREDPRMH